MWDAKEYVRFDYGSGWNIDKNEEGRITRLYFPSDKYPPPTTDKKQNHLVWGCLRNAIQNAADIGKSPVVYSGSSNTNELRFRCKYQYCRNVQNNVGGTWPK